MCSIDWSADVGSSGLGGYTGIVFECAKKYVREGARVGIAANHRASVTEAIRELGADHLGIVCDVSRPGEVKDAIAETLKEFQRINVIHNNAGIAEPSKMLHETDEAEWEDRKSTRLNSSHYCASRLTSSACNTQ